MTSFICKGAAERVMVEKGLSADAAMKFVLESTWECYKLGE
ncbi:MAG: hypothetical protein PUB46_00140 [Lachnospiraceae bacterium]|nr:hypothetical protein [Lachnospiraceae bacterium]